MNFYCDSQGVVFHVDAERIFQGSLGANKIRLIGQFPSTAQVLVAYELPDGTKTSPKIMTPVAALEQVQAPNGGLYSIWESLIGATPKIDDNGNVVTDDNGDVVYDLIPSITALYGTVRVQFFVYGASSGKLNGQVLAVASSSFTVEKGVPAEVPEFNLDDGTTLLQNILAIVANYETIVENAVFDGFVKKTGDTMTGPLIVENSRSLGRSGVIPDGFHVQSGEEAETHYGQGFILRKANTNEFPNGDLSEIVNALPQESGTLVTEEKARAIANEEIAKFDFINIVAELPETGLPNRFYLVPKENGTVTDLFDAWIWVNKGTEEEPDWKWEYEGVKSGEIDLTILKDYVKFTDYATVNKAGVIKTKDEFGTNVSGDTLYLVPAYDSEITSQSSANYRPLMPRHISKIVKVGITTNTETWTDEEKAAACETIGAVKAMIGEPDSGATRGFVYGLDSYGTTQKLFRVQIQANADTIPLRNPNGTFYVGTPTIQYEAANKGYVDDAVASAGGGTKLYKHTVHEYMEKADPNAPETTHMIISTNPNPYTIGTQIREDWLAGKILRIVDGFTHGEVVGMTDGLDFYTQYAGTIEHADYLANGDACDDIVEEL